MSESVAMRLVGEEEMSDALIAGEALLLTATHQLAIDWKRRLVSASDTMVCNTPGVMAWQSCLFMLANDSDDIPVALGDLQELLLWEKVITADRTIAAGASLRGLARHASKAWSLMQEYGIKSAELAGQGEEADALVRWIACMQSELAALGRALMADMPGLLLPRVGALLHQRRILLDGFSAFTPMQGSILQALAESGVSIEQLDSASAASHIELIVCVDAEEECRHVAHCIAELLHVEPQARIGVATSGQLSDVSVLRRHLDAALTPRVAITDGMQAALMAGDSLSSTPLIRQMLRLLQLAGKPGAPFADVSPLLFSPGLRGFSAERFARAALDASLRASGRHYIGLKAFLSSGLLGETPQLADVLKSMLLWDVSPRSAGAWVNAVHALLQSAGYLRAESEGNADAVSRSNAEVRQLNTFRECLASLVAADAVSPLLEWPGFLSLLSEACHSEPFNQTAILPQVLVLPLAQMSGLSFDAVFALAVDDAALPLSVQTVALLPFSVQRQYGLPRATAAAAFAESAFQWQQLVQAAPRVFVSYARNRDAQELNASPLLAGIEAQACKLETALAERIELESFLDAPDVPMHAAEKVEGGSGIVKNQSACAFRAFATHRLGLATLETPEPGIDAAAKGSLIHLALEYIWTHTASQAALLALDEVEVAALIETAITYALGEFRRSLPDMLRNFESERMRRVLAEWLQLERQRPSFSVESCEKAYQLQLPEGGSVSFPVRLKADRIDRDIEGHKILIDYKTGRKQSIGQWTGERMREPQLPLYSMAEELGREDAVCFARVRSGEMGFEGLCGNDTGIKGVSVYTGKDEEAEDWPALLDVWRQRINALAAEFVAGHSQVMPRDAGACSYCGLEAVCRIDEIGFPGADSNDEEGS
ncbi:MAG: PD-(D/E)XK nuclease family protein [Mariprofundaceae bacterium]|nr:PD-(D/E)XK nuclease family protein [Mariprofundaceae bacterium]